MQSDHLHPAPRPRLNTLSRCVRCVVFCLLSVVCCVLCAVCCVLCAVCCVLSVVCCVLCVVCCASCVVGCVLSVVRCVLSVVRFVLCVVRCVLRAVCCLLCVVCCVLSVVRCLLCVVCCGLRASGHQGALTSVLQQLGHLVLGGAGDPVEVGQLAQGLHQVLVLRVQGAPPDPRHGKVLGVGGRHISLLGR